ncbi:MAG: response regulator, partial [Arcobacter sp.]|nr:response regulator [Arcobacter sp.]
MVYRLELPTLKHIKVLLLEMIFKTETVQKGQKMENSILIVDDSKTILNGLKNTIESKLGYKVYAAASMKECSELILSHKGRFALALLDYGLPDAPNGEIITFVKKFNIPSIVLTGTKLDKDHAIFKNGNLIDYIIKNGSYAIDYSVGVVDRFMKNAKVEVLVVDDSKTFAAKMGTLCKKYNLSTIINYGAKEALTTLKQRPNIKLVLVDYMMPEMNGLELTMEIRKTYKKDELIVIALSGMSEKEVVASFLKYGANDFLYKDFSNEEFFARINGNLDVLELFEATQDKAKKDFLTGVFNKNYLLNIGAEIYDIAKKKKELLAVVMIDIDNFQTINESYGHEVGDEAIILLANSLLEYLNKDSIIARIGQDQFCVLLQNRPYAEIYQIFNEFKENIKSKFVEINTGKVTFTLS